jgi:antitoxin (DNA-binding transcriptional repressor) of toxin-antitoxin stability system
MAGLKTVGVRELKNRLSEYLREVRLGTTVLVTDRGTVVAEIREPEPGRVRPAPSTAIELWIQDGRASAPETAKRPLPDSGVRLRDGTSFSILDQERGA